jgi:glycosyltransferase involved in cell wall biosynthesis
MRILWLAPYTAQPAIHGGRIRLLNLVRQTVMRGHHVALWNVSNDRGAPTPIEDVLVRYVPARARRGVLKKATALLSRLPEEAWRADSASARQALRAVRKRDFDVAVLEQSHMGAHARRLDELGIPWVLDAQNVESSLLRQIAQRARRPLRRFRLMTDAAKVAQLEGNLFKRAAMIAAPSEEDAARIRRRASDARVEIHRSGVDLEYFAWTDHSTPKNAELVMTGTLGYPPNLDAAVWAYQEVVPAIRLRVGSARLSLVGNSAPKHLERLHSPAAGFEVIGQVPDVRPHLAAADVFLIPLRLGSGTRLKAVEALAAGVPIVSTSLGVEGLGVIERNLVMLAETPEEFGAAVARLLSDEALRRRLGTEGRTYVEREFGWFGIGERWVASLERLVARGGSPP